MTIPQHQLGSLQADLTAALHRLTSASSQDSSKGRAVKDWFELNFGANGKASLVNEAKQAYNRPKEQLGRRDVEHIIFVLADPKARGPIVQTFLDVSYTGLQTVLLIEYKNNHFTPLEFFESGNSKVGDFYRQAYNLSPQGFVPKHVTGQAPQNTPAQLSASSNEQPAIAEDNPVLIEVQRLLDDGFGGVIFAGPPGTSKSWYARQVGLRLVDGNKARLRFVQFHPGYQYEDFIEGYVPNDKGGFDPAPRVFLQMCTCAQEHKDQPVVIVIDEFSRTDVVRVFGEALTYLESSKRDVPFTLASGKTAHVPKNLIIIATTNPWDRGVDELDLALERRFAKVRFEPKIDELRAMLQPSQLSENVRQKLEQFFFKVSRHDNPLCRIGHAYFSGVTSIESLKRRWENQLSFHFERVLRDAPDELREVQSAWDRIFAE